VIASLVQHQLRTLVKTVVLLICIDFDHTKHATSSSPPLSQDLGIQQKILTTDLPFSGDVPLL
jgi:hypothetical protein